MKMKEKMITRSSKEKLKRTNKLFYSFAVTADSNGFAYSILTTETT